MKTMWCRRAVAGVVVPMLASACAVSGLSFVTDSRVKVLLPKDNAEVALPFEVAWTVEDFDGYFAIFFDRSPMRPGQNLRSLVPEDDACRIEPGCPDAEWLADRHIYVTDANRLAIEALPDRRDNNRSKDRHDMTVVLLDRHGRRLGESVFTKEFIVERER